jgi:hypothetical protein
VRGTRRSEVLEVEGEDRQPVPLCDRHHAPIDEAQIEIGIASIELGGAPGDSRGEKQHGVFPADERSEECTCRMWADASAEELIDLDNHRVRNEQLAPELGDERGREPVRAIAPIRRRDQRPGVGDESQRAVTSSRR